MVISILKYDLNKKTLRKFGLALGGIFLVLFGGILPFIFKIKPSLWLIGTGIMFIILALILPYIFKPIFIILNVIGAILGTLNQLLLLIIIFFFIMCPISFILWIFKYDSMKRSFNKKLKTYRVINKHTDDMTEPF